MTFSLPPVVRQAKTLARDIEQAVAKFRREHRYAFGVTLRERAWNVLELAYTAASYRERRGEALSSLVKAVDALKLSIQLGWDLRQFTSFGQFEALSRSAKNLGQQVGGWHRQHQQHPQGQSDRSNRTGQRAETLSTRAASQREANR